MTMASVFDSISLPTEIVSHVISYLLKEDLIHLCRTSKFLKSIAEPSLYKDYTNYAPHPSDPWQPPIPFARTLARRLELGAHCTYATFGTWDVEGDWRPATQYEEGELRSEDEIELLSAAAMARRLIPPHDAEQHKWAESWRANLERSVDDPVMLYILAMLPNLQKLRLEEYESASRRFSWDWLCGPNVKALSCLRELHVGHEGACIWVMAAFIPVLQLPNLCVFSASMCSTKTLDGLEPNSSALKTIDLKCSSFGVPAIGSLLNACKALQSFAYSDGGTGRTLGEQSKVGELVEPLAKHRASLKELELNIIETWMFQDDHGADMNLLYLGNALVEFTALKTLEVDYKLLNGDPRWIANKAMTAIIETPLIAALPKSIENLVIHNASPDLRPQLLDVVDKSHGFHNLKTLAVDWHERISRPSAAELQKRFSVFGVKLTFLRESSGEFFRKWPRDHYYDRHNSESEGSGTDEYGDTEEYEEEDDMPAVDADMHPPDLDEEIASYIPQSDFMDRVREEFPDWDYRIILMS